MHPFFRIPLAHTRRARAGRYPRARSRPRPIRRVSHRSGHRDAIAVPADRTPSSVTVVTGDQLRSEGITTVADALRTVPGLSIVQTGSFGGATSLFIRGGESKYAKILVDGVPINDAGGAFDLSTLSTDNLDRIEIVRGPASVLYGSDAVAGVVQLFTRRGAGAARGQSPREVAARKHDVDASAGGERG